MTDITDVPASLLFAELRKVAASRARMTVPQSRSGRRPMSVDTLLKKDRAGSLWKDHLPGGLADKKTPADFPANKLQEGRAVEREHTSSPAIQTEIAMDHISEDPNYYPKLKRMEAGEKIAVTLMQVAKGGAAVGALGGGALGAVLNKKHPVAGAAMGAGAGLLAGPILGVAGALGLVELSHTRAGSAVLEHLNKKAGLMDALKAPIPGTKDWFINTGKAGLQGASKVTGRLPKPAPLRQAVGAFRPAAPAMRTAGRSGVMRAAGGGNSISSAEMQRLGFGDLLKSGGVHPALAKLAFKLQGQTEVQGIPIAIENRKGSVRKGTDPDGTPWRTVYKIPYGYIQGTEGKDGEEIDAYVGPHKDAPEVYVIHQHKLDGTGYDEDKVMFGFLSEEEARKAYLAHYNKVGPKLLGPISTIRLDDLKKRLEKRRKHTKLAYVTGGSGSGITGNRMAMLDMDEKPERTKPGDVPSMDGTNPGTAGIVRREAGPEMATVMPTNGALANSQTGATTRL